MKLYVEEANLQKREIDRRWALTRFQRNPWTAAGECLDRTDPIRNPRRLTLQYLFKRLRTSSRHHCQNLKRITAYPRRVLGPRPDIDIPWSDIDAEMIASAVSSKRSGAAPDQTLYPTLCSSVVALSLSTSLKYSMTSLNSGFVPPPGNLP